MTNPLIARQIYHPRAVDALRPWSARGLVAPVCQCAARRFLSSTAKTQATALPITAPGPPPAPPTPEPTYRHRSRLRTSSIPKPPTTRFWKHVNIKEVDNRLQINLDTRPLKTPNKHALSVPKSRALLAFAIQHEWSVMRTSAEATKSHLIPMTSLTARAIDLELSGKAEKDEDERLKSTREEIINFLMPYLETDTLLLIAPTNTNPAELGGPQIRDIQLKVARESIDWIRSTLGDSSLEVLISDGDDGILPKKQPEDTMAFIRGYISSLGDYELVGLERAVLAGKSLLAGLRLVVENMKGGQGRWDAEQAAVACNLETDFQTVQWGSVDDTHDVNEQDLRRQLGSVLVLISQV